MWSLQLTFFPHLWLLALTTNVDYSGKGPNDLGLDLCMVYDKHSKTRGVPHLLLSRKPLHKLLSKILITLA